MVQNQNQNVFFFPNILLSIPASIFIFYNFPMLQKHKLTKKGTQTHKGTMKNVHTHTYTHPCLLGTRVQTSLHHRAGPIFHQRGGTKLKPQGHAVSSPSQGSRGRGGHCLLDIKSPWAPSGQEGVGLLLELG